MSWKLPDWMNAEDQARGAAMVEALRATVAAGFAAAEELDAEGDVDGWRWRVAAITGEARDMVTRFQRFADEVKAHAAQRAEEQRLKRAMEAAKADQGEAA